MNNTVLAPKRSLLSLKPWLVCAWFGLTLSGFSQLAQAQTTNQVESSWFEIELLAFSREPQQQLLEKFTDKVRPIQTATALDLLSRHYQPSIRSLLQALPACQATVDASMLWTQGLQISTPDFAAEAWLLANLTALPNDAEQLAFAQSPIQRQVTDAQLDLLSPQGLAIFCQYEQLPQHWQQPFAMTVRYQEQAATSLQLPVTPPGEELHQGSPYLAPETALQLKDLAYQLTHRGGHQLLLHSVWRQTLSNKAQSRSTRWFAGRNFSHQFDYLGRPRQSNLQTDQTSALTLQIQQLEQQLQQARKPDLSMQAVSETGEESAAVWQLDGLLKVYSDRMLFAEAEFNLRRLSVDGQQLQTFYSQEQTRLLIGEIHYLDHPYLGLILQIRRFTPPQLPIASQ